MAILLQINKLNYQINDDKIFNISLDVQKGDYISIIAPNKSGKTILTKLICAIIPTDNKFQIDGIILNKENVLDYLEKIGLVSNELNIFLTKKVKDELTLPLKNLGYNEFKINKRLNKIVEFFEIEDILSEDPNLLDINNLKLLDGLSDFSFLQLKNNIWEEKLIPEINQLTLQYNNSRKFFIGD